MTQNANNNSTTSTTTTLTTGTQNNSSLPFPIPALVVSGNNSSTLLNESTVINRAELDSTPQPHINEYQHITLTDLATPQPHTNHFDDLITDSSPIAQTNYSTEVINTNTNSFLNLVSSSPPPQPHTNYMLDIENVDDEDMNIYNEIELASQIAESQSILLKISQLPQQSTTTSPLQQLQSKPLPPSQILSLNQNNQTIPQPLQNSTTIAAATVQVPSQVDKLQIVQTAPATASSSVPPLSEIKREMFLNDETYITFLTNASKENYLFYVQWRTAALESYQKINQLEQKIQKLEQVNQQKLNSNSC